jgi:hypothetical protein
MIEDDKDQVIEEEVIEEDVVEEEIVENADDSDVDEDPENVQEDDGEDDDEEDRVVSIGEPEKVEGSEEDPEEAKGTPGWVKKVRTVNRHQEAEIKKLKRQIEQMNKPAEEAVKLGTEPTSASCGYDDVKLKKEILAYDARKRKLESQAVEQQKVVEEQSKQWQIKQESYKSSKKEHNFKDFQDTEELVSNTLNQAQQSIIVQGAEDSALLIYALGKNPKKLEELAKIHDYAEFTFKVAKVEAQLKVTKRKAPGPEKRIKKGKAGGLSGNSDAVLQKLRDEADRTGDRSKVHAYMMEHRT